MKTLSAKFNIVTPMFLGDAEQKATSIRPPSIKGALRFWWRALNWKNAIEDRSEDEALVWLHREESRIFGHAADESNTQSGRGGQGVFVLAVKHGKLQTYAKGSEPFGKSIGIEYLMGQGLWHFKNKLTRNAIKEGQDFTVSIAFKPTVSDADITSVMDAFCLFGMLGGLGSRARHGFGSIALAQIETDGIELPCKLDEVNTSDGYASTIQRLIGRMANVSQPPISAFSSDSVVSIVCEKSKISQILSYVGDEMQLYRSYGRNGQVGGKAAEQNFCDDHDNVRNMSLNRPPRRSIFGLPHNYFFSSDKMQVDVNAEYGHVDARRPSPLLLHIHPVGNAFVAVHVLLKSLFLPKDASIVVKNKKTKKKMEFSPDVDYGVIEQYLKRFKNAQRIVG